ncbi:MAG: hypothetical protein ACTHWM_08260 [Yaniella sp.]|uniref:hypothetical protein n=1 Tax=Yaniella sp. TaxID=2773929 RepID=UPI003F9756DF
MGLTAGLVPPRVDATVKAGLLNLVEHAQHAGDWSVRRAAAVLGLEHVRVLRWQRRATTDRLADARPGPDYAVHALLAAEVEAILDIAEAWGSVDRSHRKLAHRGSRLDAFYASESTVLRVLQQAGLRCYEVVVRVTRVANRKKWLRRWATSLRVIHLTTHPAGVIPVHLRACMAPRKGRGKGEEGHTDQGEPEQRTKGYHLISGFSHRLPHDDSRSFLGPCALKAIVGASVPTDHS